MASIIKRKKNLSVVYYYKENEESEPKQQWDTVDNEVVAKQRKRFIEYYQESYGKIGLVPEEYQFYAKENRTKLEKDFDVATSTPKNETTRFTTGKTETTNSDIEEVQEEKKFVPSNTASTLNNDENSLYKDYLVNFVDIYGARKWGVRTYKKNLLTIKNYILPHLGEFRLSEITTKLLDEYYQFLLTLPQIKKEYDSDGKLINQHITPATIHQVHKLICTSFTQAMRWDLVQKNPDMFTTRPKYTQNKRDVWGAKTLIKAMELCTDEILLVCMHLGFACSMRIGEITGLQWDKVFISDEDIKKGNARLVVDRELTRVDKQVLEKLDYQDIIFMFPTLYPNCTSRLVLKTPKTESSERVVWIPNTIAMLLRKLKTHQEGLKEILGSEYHDYNLVVSQQNGRPVENHVMNRRWRQFIKKQKLPHVTFHSLRHTSTTYKLKMTNGDIKAVQGDTGHAESDMVLNVYSHIMDEDRKQNAVQLDEEFYTKLDDDFYKEFKYKENDELFHDEIKEDLVSSNIIDTNEVYESPFANAKKQVEENQEKESASNSALDQLQELLKAVPKETLAELLLSTLNLNK